MSANFLARETQDIGSDCIDGALQVRHHLAGADPGEVHSVEESEDLPVLAETGVGPESAHCVGEKDDGVEIFPVIVVLGDRLILDVGLLESEVDGNRFSQVEGGAVVWDDSGSDTEDDAAHPDRPCLSVARPDEGVLTAPHCEEERSTDKPCSCKFAWERCGAQPVSKDDWGEGLLVLGGGVFLLVPPGLPFDVHVGLAS